MDALLPVTVDTIVVVMVVVKTGTWPAPVMATFDALGDDAGTSSAPATYTSVTF